MRNLFLILGLLFGISIFSTASATTYYVRTDGGTATQCTGTTNAAYPGTGTAQACAFNHPFWVLVPGQGTSLMKAGDTLSIGSGSYMMGYGAPNAPAGNCQPDGTPLCYIKDIPSGIDAAHPTVITGDCTAPPELWGTGGIDGVFWVTNSHDITFNCLNLTDHDDCYPDGRSASGVIACQYGVGKWSGVGIYMADDKDMTITNSKLHGFASDGVWAGRLSGVTTITNVQLVGNGSAGWDGDLGGNTATSGMNSGTLTFTDVTIAWNGCLEKYPYDGSMLACAGSNSGGYGDGIGTAKTGGNWIFIRPIVYRNTSDGIDMLYADGTGNVTIEDGWFADNVGNDIKVSGTGRVAYNTIIADCSWYGNTTYPAKADICRAGGGLLGAFNGPNQSQTWTHNTMIGNPSGMFVGDSTNAQSTDTYYIANNIFIGVATNGVQPFFTWFSDSTYPEKVVYDKNIIWNLREGNGYSCTTAGLICVDPLLKNETLSAFDPHLLPNSPAIGTASGAYQ